jgi:hypothetical protein
MAAFIELAKSMITANNGTRILFIRSSFQAFNSEILPRDKPVVVQFDRLLWKGQTTLPGIGTVQITGMSVPGGLRHFGSG